MFDRREVESVDFSTLINHPTLGIHTVEGQGDIGSVGGDFHAIGEFNQEFHRPISSCDAYGIG